MNRSMLRLAAAVGASALLFATPATAAKKKVAPKPKTTKPPATTAATTVATTEAPATTAPATTAAPVTTAAPAKVAGAPVKIGLLSAETGNASSAYKNAPGVAIAWQKWVNEEKGGIAGHPVEVVTADDKNTAAEAQAAAKDLIESKGIVAIILQDSTAESALQTYINEKKFPVVGGSANNAAAGIGYGVSPYYFPTATGAPTSGEIPVIMAKALGQGPYSAAVCAEVAACAASAKQAENKAKALGLDYAGVLTVSGSAPNYTAECLEIQSRIAGASSRSAGYVSIGLAPTAMTRLINDCIRQGYQGYFGASSNTASEALLDKIDGIKMGGYVNGFPWWSDAAPVKNFRDVVAKYNKGAEFRDPAATSTWATLELFRKVMNAAGAPASKDDVLKAYWGVKDEALDGLLPKPVTYTEGKPSLINCFWPFQYKDKKFTTYVLDKAFTGNGQTGDLRTACN
jgi:branched-chain amino acid transport system substrate-binding protein